MTSCCSVTPLCPTLQPRGLQHTRPSCPSPSHEVFPSSYPLHQWCHPVISYSDTFFSFCHQSFSASGTFLVGRLFTSEDQNTGASASASVFPSIQGWFPQDWLFWSPCCLRDSQGSSLAPQLEGINSLALQHFTVQHSQPYVTTAKTIALLIWTFDGRVMSLVSTRCLDLS